MRPSVPKELKPRDLGADIILYSGQNATTLSELQGRRRFLDVLWLPVSTSQLEPGQIAVISRFREQRFEDDPQFGHATRSRAALVAGVVSLEPNAILEIGCGKFPIAWDIPDRLYKGIEIDPEAISYCNAQGLDVSVLSEDVIGDDGVFDIVISLYAFHFPISSALIDFISRCVAHDGVLVFNIIADDGADILSKLASFTSIFPIVRVLKTHQLTTREFFIVMGTIAAASKIERLCARLGVAQRIIAARRSA